jgi:hypothetical protein
MNPCATDGDLLASPRQEAPELWRTAPVGNANLAGVQCIFQHLAPVRCGQLRAGKRFDVILSLQ